MPLRGHTPCTHDLKNLSLGQNILSTNFTQSLNHKLIDRVDDPEAIIRQSSTSAHPIQPHYHQRSIKDSRQYTSDKVLFASIPHRPTPATSKPYQPPPPASPNKIVPGSFPASPTPHPPRLPQILQEEERLSLAHQSTFQPQLPSPLKNTNTMTNTAGNQEASTSLPSTDDLERF